jgi:hypothetical protein
MKPMKPVAEMCLYACLGYLLCLAGCPTIYERCSSDFMYTTDAAQIELDNFRQVTLKKFDDSLVVSTRDTVGSVPVNGWKIYVRAVRLEDISFAEKNRTRLEWSVPIVAQARCTPTPVIVPISVTFGSWSDRKHMPPLEGIPVVAHLALVEGAEEFPGLASAFLDSVITPDWLGSRLEGGLNIPTSLEYRLRKLELGERGHPIARPEGYWDFLYFSVVTITTLGFGDVIPSTGFGRFLVGAEATLGLGLITIIAGCVGVLMSNLGKKRP